MAKHTFEVGTKVWFHNGGKGNPLVKGRIVHIMRIEGYSFDHCVIGVPTGIEDTLHVRDIMTISFDKKGPINLWKKSTMWSNTK